MHSQLRERIRLMRARLDNAAPVAEIRAESQLFVTPAPVCDRLVTLAEISNRDHILEPSAGTGAILRAIRDTAPGAMCDAVEINSGLVRYLRENFNGVRVQCGDFMEWQPVQYYSRIIMNPPFSHGQDIRNVLLPSFANAFTEAGFATITFDYRGFGESEGERGRLVPAMQTEDIISVINWAEKQVCIDNQRIGLWGTSLGGCHVFNAAAQDKRVKSIVSQLAFADGEVLVTGEMNELEKASFLSTLNKMAEKKKNTGKEMFVGVTRVLSDNESKVFFEKVKGQYPEMDIKIPFLTVMETLQYKPAESAAKVQCPVLVVIAGQDSVNPPEQGRALYDAVASGTKELYEEADACHYDIYKGAFFERVAAVQTQWFKKHL